MAIKNYKELDVWNKAMALTNLIYDVTSDFPKSEIYGLANQMRCAAISIPSNIAEGSAHENKPEFSRFINIARGSLAELENQIILACGRKYIISKNNEDLANLSNDISRMLVRLLQSIKA